MPRILIVDDEESIRLTLRDALSGRHGVDLAADAEAAREALRAAAYDLLITDWRMGVLSGMDLLREAKAMQPRLPVIMMTAHGSVEHAVEAMKAGADDYLSKPFSLAEIELRVASLLEKSRLREERDELRRESAGGHALVGESPAFLAVRKLIAQAGPSEAAVLILGETGTGKEGVARALHAASPRAKGPFVAVNCSAFAPGIIESELFGHEKGAFTGAERARRGRLEQADGGTLFLDEVGDLTPEAQVKLLRAIEQKSFERVGGDRLIKSDFRLLAATHRDLQARVQEGAFREDLLFRLNVFPLQLPPLRERGEDATLLARHFIKLKAPGRNLKLGEGSGRLLKRYAWPGNVRELQNIVERAIILSEGEILRLDLALGDAAEAGSAAPSPGRGQLPPGKNLAQAMDDAEKAIVAVALKQAEGNQSQAAKALGIERSTLQYKLKKYGLLAWLLLACTALHGASLGKRAELKERLDQAKALPTIESAKAAAAAAQAELEAQLAQERAQLELEAQAWGSDQGADWWNLPARKRAERRLRRLRMRRAQIEKLEKELQDLKKAEKAQESPPKLP